MDHSTLQKLGNVTIEKIPPSTEVSDDVDVSVSTKEPSATSISSRGIQLPKLPPSINITIKPNSSSIANESPVSDENVEDESEELQYSDHYQIQSSTCVEIETEDVEGVDAPSNLSSPCESSSEICDNSTESTGNVHSENVEPTDLQELSESLDNQCEETVFGVGATVVADDEKMDYKEAEEKESVEQEYEDEPELPEVKEEFVEEYGVGESAMCSDDLPEVPVNELIEGELPESVICKEEEFSEKESDTTSDDADDELDEGQDPSDDAGTATKRKKKRKTKSEDDVDESSSESKKQKTSSGMWYSCTNEIILILCDYNFFLFQKKPKVMRKRRPLRNSKSAVLDEIFVRSWTKQNWMKQPYPLKCKKKKGYDECKSSFELIEM